MWGSVLALLCCPPAGIRDSCQTERGSPLWPDLDFFADLFLGALKGGHWATVTTGDILQARGDLHPRRIGLGLTACRSTAYQLARDRRRGIPARAARAALGPESSDLGARAALEDAFRLTLIPAGQLIRIVVTDSPWSEEERQQEKVHYLRPASGCDCADFEA